MDSIVRRTAALLAVPALTLTGLVATSSPASAATDPAPATAAGSWLGGQLTDGIVHNEQYDFDDYGLTIDVGLALKEVGAPSSAVESISDAVASHIDEYVAPGFGTNLSAGAAAKALVLAAAAGDDPTSYGGRDLVSDLEGTVSTDGVNSGRIVDDYDTGDENAADYANVFGQAFAAEGLDAVDSTDTDAVTGFLLDQQCSAGYFRQSFADVGADDQTCDGGDGQPNVDVTALAVQALQSQLDDSDVAGHVADAVTWLLSVQKDDGSFGSDADIPAGNANSTGAAAYALLVSGEDAAAAKAAAWLRAHQATNVASCTSYDDADTGAVLYDDDTLTTAQGGAMDAALRDQSVRATAQALPGLLAAEAGDGDPHALFTAEYVKAGGRKPVGVNGAAPGEALCAMLGEQSVLGYADPKGEASLPVRIPRRTATSSVDVANADGVFGTVDINALGRTRLHVVARKQHVHPGGKQVVVVRHLAPGETATVQVTWASGRHSASGAGAAGQANRHGVLRAVFKVPHRVGKARVKAFGEFHVRRGGAAFHVTH